MQSTLLQASLGNGLLVGGVPPPPVPGAAQQPPAPPGTGQPLPAPLQRVLQALQLLQDQRVQIALRAVQELEARTSLQAMLGLQARQAQLAQQPQQAQQSPQAQQALQLLQKPAVVQALQALQIVQNRAIQSSLEVLQTLQDQAGQQGQQGPLTQQAHAVQQLLQYQPIQQAMQALQAVPAGQLLQSLRVQAAQAAQPAGAPGDGANLQVAIRAGPGQAAEPGPSGLKRARDGPEAQAHRHKILRAAIEQRWAQLRSQGQPTLQQYKAHYLSLPPAERARRFQALRFALYHKGDRKAYSKFGEEGNFRELVELEVPRKGAWPGFSRAKADELWATARARRYGFEAESRVMLPPRGNPLQAALEAAKRGPTRRETRELNRKVQRRAREPLLDMKKAANSVARRLHPHGLKFRRILGTGGFGLAALFEASRPGNPRKKMQFVAKAPLGEKRTGTDQFAKEKRIMEILAGAQHIVQPLRLGEFNQGKDPESSAAASADIDQDDNLVLAEFMSMGDLSGLIGRLIHSQQHLPNRALWRLLDCLAQAAMALQMPPGKHKEIWDAYRKEDKEKAEKNGDPVPALVTERVPPKSQVRRENTIVHFDIDPKNVLFKDDDIDHSDFPIFKINDFGLSRLADNKFLDDEIAMQMARARGKAGFLAPEQFTDEWEHHAGNPIKEDPSDSLVAGNYDSAMNVWQIGLVMQAAIVFEKPPEPPVPELYKVNPEGRAAVPDSPPPAAGPGGGAEQEAAAAGAGQSDTAAAEAQAAAEDAAAEEMEEEAAETRKQDKGKGREDAEGFPPYSRRTKSGYIWTYAAQLLRDTETCKMTDPRLLDCICRMLAHRPVDRISLGELRAEVDQALARVRPGGGGDGDEGDGTEGGQDDDYYNDEYIQLWIKLLYAGLSDHNVVLQKGFEDVPFLDAESEEGDEGEDEGEDEDEDDGEGEIE